MALIDELRHEGPEFDWSVKPPGKRLRSWTVTARKGGRWLTNIYDISTDANVIDTAAYIVTRFREDWNSKSVRS